MAQAGVTADAVDRSAVPWLPRRLARSHTAAALVGALIAGPAAWGLYEHQGRAIIPTSITLLTGAALVVTAQERVQRLIGSGRLDNRPLPRSAFAFMLFGIALHVSGVGFLFPISAVVVSAVHVHWSGSAAWRGIAKLAVAATLVGQLLVGLHLAPSVLPVASSHVIALTTLALSLIAVNNVGLTAERREQATRALARAETRFRTLVQNSSDVVTVLDRDGCFTYVSPAALVALGHRPEDLVGRAGDSLVVAQDVPRFREHLAKLAEVPPGSAVRWEARVRYGDGTQGWVEFSGHNLLDDDVVGGVMVHLRDVTERRAFSDRLAFAATHDALTGLRNRGAFLVEAADLLATARPGAAVAVLYCDLDGFKEINDSFGHAAGDEVLVIAAERLRSQLRPGDLLARMGGDEFTAALPNLAGSEVATAILERLRAAFAAPVRLSRGQEVTVGISIGLVLVDRGNADVKDVLRVADRVMYQRKCEVRLRAGLPLAG